jgi:hypothetical protein
MDIRIVIIISFLFFTLNSTANKQDSLVNRIFNLTYNQEYILADSILQTNKDKIDELYFTVLEIDLSYWKNVSGTNNPDYNAFEETLHNYQSKTTETFEQKVIQLITLSYQLRYELKRYKLFSAIFTHKNTKTVFNELKTDSKTTTFQQQELLQLYSSVFLYFDNYLNPFGRESKKAISQQALLNMEKLVDSDEKMLKTLASYFIGKTYLKYEKVPEKGIPYFQYLCKQYPDNTKFTELLKRCKNKGDI